MLSFLDDLELEAIANRISSAILSYRSISVEGELPPFSKGG
jgi:hypothetical protein